MLITLGVTLKLPITPVDLPTYILIFCSVILSVDIIFIFFMFHSLKPPQNSAPRARRLVAGGHHGGIDAGRHVELDGQQDIGDYRLGWVLGRFSCTSQWGVLKKPWIFTNLSDIWLKLGFLVVCPKWWINKFNLNISFIYIYIIIYLVTRGYLTLSCLLIHSFFNLKILQPLQHSVLCVEMKLVFRCCLAHACLFFTGICIFFDFDWLTLHVAQKYLFHLGLGSSKNKFRA